MTRLVVGGDELYFFGGTFTLWNMNKNLSFDGGEEW